MTTLYPNDVNLGRADIGLPGLTSETAVRAAIIAGYDLSALAGTPDAGNAHPVNRDSTAAWTISLADGKSAASRYTPCSNTSSRLPSGRCI